MNKTSANTTCRPTAPSASMASSGTLTLGDLIDEHVRLAEECLRLAQRVKELEAENQELMLDKLVQGIYPVIK